MRLDACGVREGRGEVGTAARGEGVLEDETRGGTGAAEADSDRSPTYGSGKDRHTSREITHNLALSEDLRIQYI